MSTISVTEDVKEALLEIALELQIRWGRRVNLNKAIRYLISRSVKRPELLDKACKPIGGFGEAYKELKEERRKDEERAFRKFSSTRGLSTRKLQMPSSENLMASGYIILHKDTKLVDYAAAYKSERRISITDVSR